MIQNVNVFKTIQHVKIKMVLSQAIQIGLVQLLLQLHSVGHFNTKMTSRQHRNSHHVGKTILSLSDFEMVFNFLVSCIIILKRNLLVYS